MTTLTADQDTKSTRVHGAQLRAEERLRRQRDLLRPLGWALIAVVVATAVTQRPSPGPTVSGVAVATACIVFAVTTVLAIGRQFVVTSQWVQISVLVTMAAAGVTLSWLQPRGATDLAAGAAAWMAITRLQLATGVTVAAGAGLAEAAAAARTGSASAVVAVLLVTALLGLVAYLMRLSRESQAGTELLLAQLADARDAQAEAAVVAERGRIAAELHDVLAHSLSGAALQLQGARLLAEREDASPTLRDSVEAAVRLVADGLVNARQAVQTLRGADLPSLAQLDSLVADCRRDLILDVTLQVEGTPHDLSPERALALFRGVQEALTNAARHSPGATTVVLLRYTAEVTGVEVRTGRPVIGRTSLTGVGGGNGLAGLRERLERAGGTMTAGPTDEGWLVSMAIPRTKAPA